MKVLRWLLVTVGALALTSVGIFAFDSSDLAVTSLLGSVYEGGTTKGRCGEEMVFVGSSSGGFCIDAYEASPSKSCKNANPKAKRDTDENLELVSCSADSVEGVLPWTNISRHQAELACARANKRLPTSEEWYKAALGTPDTNSDDGCNLRTLSSDDPDKTGAHAACVSPGGARDMIGNVWEWLEETVTDGSLEGVALPGEGYVASIYANGMPNLTSEEVGDSSFYSDYFWVEQEGTKGILRGGFWKSQSDGGLYATNVTVSPSFYGAAIGFRCVKNIDS